MLDYFNIMKLLISTIVGLLVGFTRKNTPAGSRTFSLICLGSTLFTIISISQFAGTTDPTRILGQIVTGIGFLGMGVIWKHGGKLSGLTTAATIWLVAGLGILVGLGMWVELVISTILAILILYSKEEIKRLEKRTAGG